jgi:hypothetical protein
MAYSAGSAGRGASVLICAALLVACKDAVEPPTRSISRAAIVSRPRPEPPGEAHFRDLARQSPEFAGYYYDTEGTLIINSTEASPSQRLRQAVDSIWNAHAKHFSGRVRGQAQFRIVVYSFAQLAIWRDLALDAFFRIAGVRFLDLDEVHNALAVGIDSEISPTAVIDLRASAASLGIPLEALHVTESGPVVFDSDALSAATHTLQSSQRPLQAGYQVSHYKGTVQHGCTIGWVTYNDGVPVIASASHCSPIEGQVDGGTFYQAQAPSAVGVEVDEPDVYVCGDDPCHYGDVNVIQLNSGITFDPHVIARPNSGSISINHSKPTIQLIQEYVNSYVGMQIGQIGRSSGWKEGSVVGTCTHYKGDTPWIVLCVDKASYSSQGGDSGAPVFSIISDAQSTGSFAGIHSGRQWELFWCACWRSLFTPMSVIYSEFPDLQPLPW